MTDGNGAEGGGRAAASRAPGMFEPPVVERHRPSFATLIVNPRAGGGRVGRELPGIEDGLRRAGLPHRVHRTRGRGDATRAARAALEAGERFLVAVGGDGTVNEVLNGMLEDDAPVAPDAVLGVLAANSGSDVVRTFGLPQDPAGALPRLVSGNVYLVDVGAVSAGEEGEGATSERRYFLNMAQVGLAGAAAHRAGRLPRALGRSRFFLAYWMTMATYRRPVVRLWGDRREHEGVVTNLLVANLQFAGNGMLVSPKSWPEDGYFDLLVFTGPKSESFTLLPKMFVGDHLPHPRIQEYRSREVRVEADRPLAIEVDGEPAGRTPATFRNLPRLLRLKV